MLTYLIRRLVSAAISLVLVAGLVFGAVLLVPGDPAEVVLGTSASPQALAALREQLGLNRPPLERFLTWFAGVLRGDLGVSLSYRLGVRELILARLWVSLPLALLGLLLAALVALPLGVLAALSRGKGLDPVVTALAQVGAAVPSFWLGLLLILLFSVTLGWLPSGGFVPWTQSVAGALRSLLLPSLALGLGQAAVLTRMTRGALVDALAQDYTRTARAKGLPRRRVVVKHALRNAMTTLVTVLGLGFTQLLVGAIVVEQVFALPGLGRLALTAIGNRDFPLLQGEVLLYASLIIAVNTLVDVMYGVLEPRIQVV